MSELGPRPSPMEVWASLGWCGVCGAEVEFDPSWFKVAPQVSWSGKGPRVIVPGRAILGALYYRDPLHHPGKPFVNYCGAVCSNQATR